jgi:hypothetical protein
MAPPQGAIGAAGNSSMVRAVVLISLTARLTVVSSGLQADTGSCGGATTTLPFTDVQGNPFLLSACRGLVFRAHGWQVLIVYFVQEEGGKIELMRLELVLRIAAR